MNTIKCEYCGGPYETKRVNAKLCRVCQLARDTEYVHGSTQKCLDCGERFVPLSVSKRPFCGKCTQASSTLYVKGDCAICTAKDTTLIHKDLAVCLPCSTSIKTRDRLLSGIRKKQRERKAYYGAKVPRVESTTAT